MPASPVLGTTGDELQITLSLLPSFRFAHEPSALKDPVSIVGRTAELDAFIKRLRFSEGGSFLITGYRGVGKTSFVNQALSKLREDLKPATKLVAINLNLSRSMTPSELMHHIIRHLWDTLTEDEILHRLPHEVRYQLGLAYSRTSLNVTKKLVQSSDLTRGFPEFKIGIPSFSASSKGIWTRKSSHSDASEMTYLSYDDRAAEHDVISIARRLKCGYRCGKWHLDSSPPFIRTSKEVGLKIVFIFDELDKLPDNASLEQSQHSRVPFDSVDELLNSLKTLFTTSGLSFIFVAGKAFHNRWSESVRKGDSIYESVFSYQTYLPCLWADGPSPYDNWIDWSSIEGERRAADSLPFRCAACPKDSESKPVFCLSCCNFLIETNETTQFTLEFRRYLAFVGRGVPRKILRAFNEVVEWKDNGPVIAVSKALRRRISFYSELQKILGCNWQQLLAPIASNQHVATADSLRLTVYHLLDCIFEVGDKEFSFADLQKVASQLNERIAPEEAIASTVIARLADTLIQNLYLIETTSKESGNWVDGAGVTMRRFQIASARLKEIEGFNPPKSGALTVPTIDQYRIGEYNLHNLIGTGSMGAIYETIHRSTGRVLALKVLTNVTALSRVLVNTFKREAILLESLDHPAIVKCFGFKIASDCLHLPMELIEGQNLSTFVRECKHRSFPVAIPLLIGILDGIAYVHGQGLVVSDIRPSNVMVQEDGSPIMIELRLMKRTGEKREKRPIIAGTRAYMAPEQLTGDAGGNTRTNVYSFGLLMYYVFTGSAPYVKLPLKELTDQKQTRLDLSLLRELGIDSEIAATIAAAIDPVPECRPTVEVLGDKLREFHKKLG